MVDDGSLLINESERKIGGGKMDANVYQHFRADERSFIDSVGDWIEQVQGQYAPYLTEFLDPRQSYILET